MSEELLSTLDDDNEPKPKPTPASDEFRSEAEIASGITEDETAPPMNDAIAFDDASQEVDPNQLNKCAPSREDKKSVVRFALLDFCTPRYAWSHFVEKGEIKKTFRCLGQDGKQHWCCKQLGEDAQFHVVALVARYTNCGADGAYKKDGPAPECVVEYVYLSRSNYRSINHLADKWIEDLPEEAAKITAFDLDIIMGHDQSRAFGYSFGAMNHNPVWKRNPDLVKFITEEAARFNRDEGKILRSRLGKAATYEEWEALLEIAE